MKKLTYLLATILMVFTTACDPMEDVYEEIGNSETVITGEIAFELTDEDYETLELSYGSFSSAEDAKTMLPGFLEEKFPVWGEGSLALVTFELYYPKRTEKSQIHYTVSDSDYDALGFTYGNFSKSTDMIEFLEWKYPNPDDRVLVSLTYKYYSGSVNTLNDGFIYVNGEWNFLQGFTNSEYNDMEQTYPNFNNTTVAESYIPLYLNDYYKFSPKEAGQIVGFMYKVFQKDVDDIDEDGETDDKTTYSYAAYFITDGSSWTLYDNVVTTSLQFGHDGLVWVPDNTINYILTTADYDSLGTEWGDPGYYNNFDVRPGEPNFTDTDDHLTSINIILKANFPDAEEGQKFNVFYAVYSGTDEVWNLKVILVNGEYVLQEE